MRTKDILTSTLVALCVLACSKNDDTEPPEPVVIDRPDPMNQAPGVFNLLSVVDNDTNVNPSPTFTWEQATDPDGDEVVYDLYLDTKSEPDSLIASSLNSTSFEIIQNLEFETEYFWKVVAKDNLGAEKQTVVFSFITKKFPHLATFTEIFQGGQPQIRPFVFDDEGRLEVFEYYGDVSTVFYDSSGRVSSIFSDKYGFAVNYTYDQNDQLKIIEDVRGKQNWILSRDDQGRIIQVKSITVSNSANTYVLKYADHSDLPMEIWLNGKLSAQYFWDSNGNPIKSILYNREGNLNASVTNVFDDKYNPWHSIISEKFGFKELFFISREFTSRTAGFNFFSRLLRISKNNLVSSSIVNSSVIVTIEISYEYNDDDFPVESIRKIFDNDEPRGETKTIYEYSE